MVLIASFPPLHQRAVAAEPLTTPQQVRLVVLVVAGHIAIQPPCWRLPVLVRLIKGTLAVLEVFTILALVPPAVVAVLARLGIRPAAERAATVALVLRRPLAVLQLPMQAVAAVAGLERQVQAAAAVAERAQ
jgi:hypothetical protein